MRDTAIGRGSVYKWMRLSELPPRRQMDPRHGMPAFYRGYLQQRWTAGQQSGRQLMAEIKTRGYVGGYAGLAKLLAPWREAPPVRPEPPPIAHVESGAPMAVVAVRHVSPRIAAALLGQPRPLLNEGRAQTVDALKAQCPGFTTMRRLVLSFGTILRRRQGGDAAPLDDARARHQHPSAAAVRADLAAGPGGRRRRRHRAVEQRAGRRTDQPTESLAAPDVRARRRRALTRTALAAAVTRHALIFTRTPRSARTSATTRPGRCPPARTMPSTEDGSYSFPLQPPTSEWRDVVAAKGLSS
jgi:hypothetical protein